MVNQPYKEVWPHLPGILLPMAFRVSPLHSYSRSCSFSRQHIVTVQFLREGDSLLGDQMVPEILSYWAFGFCEFCSVCKSPCAKLTINPESLFTCFLSSRPFSPLSIHLDHSSLQVHLNQPFLLQGLMASQLINNMQVELFILLPSLAWCSSVSETTVGLVTEAKSHSWPPAPSPSPLDPTITGSHQFCLQNLFHVHRLLFIFSAALLLSVLSPGSSL